jgi:hypothetical protein
MSHTAALELQDLEQSLKKSSVLSPLARDNAIKQLEKGMRLLSHATVHGRRALASFDQTGDLSDGFQTLAQALGDQARVHAHAIEVWNIVRRLKEDPVNALQFVLRFERQMRRDWDRARRVLRPQEMLSRFYTRGARLVAYVAALRKCRKEPQCRLQQMLEEARIAFENWLQDYPFQATRDPGFDDVETIKVETDEVICDMEDTLRSDARRWIAGGEDEKYN